MHGRMSDRSTGDMAWLTVNVSWMIIGIVTSILLGVGSISSFVRLSSITNWDFVIGMTTSVAGAVLWFVIEKCVLFFGITVGMEQLKSVSWSRIRWRSARHRRSDLRSQSLEILWASGIIFGSVVEEIFWRGVMWQLLAGSAELPLVWVVVITSGGFAVTHFDSGIAGVISKLMGGIILGAWVILFGSVLFAVIMHLSFNTLVLLQHCNVKSGSITCAE